MCPQITQTQLAENVPWFLLLCWAMVKSAAWSGTGTRHMINAAHSFPHLLNLAPIRPQHPRLSTVTQHFGAQTGDVLAMRYRVVIQKMNKYRQLDLARVNLFRDIESLVRSILTTEEDALTVTSATTRTAAAVDATPTTSIKAHGMSRLLDNLWLTAELVDSSTKHSAPKRGAGRTKPVSGIETLRTEFDALKEHTSHATTYTTSECSFLKWASAAIPTERSIQTLPPSPKDKIGDLSQPLKPLPVPDHSNHTVKSGRSTGNKTHEEVLDKSVFDAIPMMGSLEECILELMDTGSLCFSEICSMSGGIDKSFSTIGLTVEDIDRYCSELDDSLGSEHSAGVGQYEQDIFEYMDSAYYSDTAHDNTSAKTKHNQSALYDHLLQQLIVPVTSNETELSNLRQLHGNTMMRTANVCAKFCPFEIAWSKEALQHFS